MSWYPLFSTRICINIDSPLVLDKVLTSIEFRMITFSRVYDLLLDWLPPNDPSFDHSTYCEMVNKKECRRMAPLFTYFLSSHSGQYPLSEGSGGSDKSVELFYNF